MFVDNHLESIDDDRKNQIERIDLGTEDTEPTEESKSIAEKYGVTETPTLVVTDSEGKELEKIVGGLLIVLTIQKFLDHYGVN
jgi:thioredoxin-related protein